MSDKKPNTTNHEYPDEDAFEEPGRTPGKAEGDEQDIEQSEADRRYISGPQAAENEKRSIEEPKRTPGKAEG